MIEAERERSTVAGVFSATGAAIKYIALPLLLIYLVQRLLPDLKMDFSSFIAGTIIVGLALMTAGFIYGYYWKGSQKRLIAGLLGVILADIWILVIVGTFNIGASFESFSFRLSMEGMFLIIAAGISLKGLYHFAEYKVYKREIEDEEARRRQMQQYQSVQYQNSQPYPQQYPQQQSYVPPPPPPPSEEREAVKEKAEKIEFRPYSELKREESDSIEWKKPEEDWEIKPHHRNNE